MEKKDTVSSIQKLALTSGNEGLTEKYVSVEEKTACTCSSWLLSEKMEKNGFH